MNGEARSRVVDQEAGSTPSTLRDEDHPSRQRLFGCLPYDIDLNPLRIVSFIYTQNHRINKINISQYFCVKLKNWLCP